MKISEKAAIRSPWFIGWMILLLVVIGANIVMILFALDNNPGLVAKDYYERGVRYDKELHERQKNDPGWKSQYLHKGELYLNRENKIFFKLTDKNGNSIVADKVTLFVYRPSDHKKDFSVPMNSGDGIEYQAVAHFPLKGVWDFVVEVIKGEERRNFAQRVKVYTQN